MSPHDGIVRKFFADKETAESFFREYLPAETVSDLPEDKTRERVSKILIEGGEIMATLAQKWFRQGRAEGKSGR